MIQTSHQLAERVGVSTACTVLGVPHSSFYRTPDLRRGLSPTRVRRTAPGRALTEEERGQVRDLLNSERFQDQAPRQVWAQLLDDGV